MNLRQMEIVTDADKLKVDIQQTCMQYKTIKQWAYILHDKDDTRPHYHIYLNFMPNTCDTALVAKWFNLGWMDENGKEHSGENFIDSNYSMSILCRCPKRHKRLPNLKSYGGCDVKFLL